MTTLESIIDQIHAAGLAVEAGENGTLLVRPKGRVSVVIGELVKANKPLLLAWLAAPWDGQAQADEAITAMNAILDGIQVPVETPQPCVAAQINLVRDCREVAASRISARWLAGVLRMPDAARQLKTSVEKYCREEVYHRRIRSEVA